MISIFEIGGKVTQLFLTFIAKMDVNKTHLIGNGCLQVMEANWPGSAGSGSSPQWGSDLGSSQHAVAAPDSALRTSSGQHGLAHARCSQKRLLNMRSPNSIFAG
jgi:hypothetical protein